MKWNDLLKANVDWDNPRYRQFLRSLMNEMYPDYSTRGLGQNRIEQRIVMELKALPREEISLPPIDRITGKFRNEWPNALSPEGYVNMVDKVRAIIKRVFEQQPPQDADVDEFELLAAKLGGRIIMRHEEDEDRYRTIPAGRKRTTYTWGFGKVIMFTDKFNVVWQIDIANEKVIISKGRARNLLEGVDVNSALHLLRSLVNEEFYTGPLLGWYEYTLNELNIKSKRYPNSINIGFDDVFKNPNYYARGRPNATLISGASEQDKKRISLYAHRNHREETGVYAKISVIENGELVELEPNIGEDERVKMSAKRYAQEANYDGEGFRELHLLDKIGAFRSSNPDAVAQSAVRFIGANLGNRRAAVEFFDSYLRQTNSRQFFTRMIKRSQKLRSQRWRILNSYYWAQDFFENYDYDLRGQDFEFDED